MATQSEQLLKLIPIDQIAKQVGASPEETAAAVAAALPGLLGGLTKNSQDADGAAALESALAKHAASKVIGDGKVKLDEVDTADGAKIVKHALGSDAKTAAKSLSLGSAANSGLLQKVLPILAPIVMAFLAQKVLSQKTTTTASGGVSDVLGNILGGFLGGGSTTTASSGGLGGILGSVLGGGSSSSGNAVTDALGAVLGGATSSSGGGITDALGGLLGGVMGSDETPAEPATTVKKKTTTKASTSAKKKTTTAAAQEQADDNPIGDILGKILGG
ncbi:MAG: DUF937 domain-containing protein [Propionibacteriaceae bacterium]|nr:DUF937 domain-containing protein [Propionibacteriaceae bacterium]